MIICQIDLSKIFTPSKGYLPTMNAIRKATMSTFLISEITSYLLTLPSLRLVASFHLTHH